MKIQPVIMSGGAGTRLWPLSRKARPKQFLNLAGDTSLFQETAQRLSDDGDVFAPPLVIAGRGHGGLVAEQLGAVGIAPAQTILEPCPRNTAAVAAVAALWTARAAPDALILLAPADHHIEDAVGFRRAAARGAKAAAAGRIVTFGIKPTHAHTGYGYIQAAEEIGEEVFRVQAFKEKPDGKTAQTYLDAGGYYWNAGIFLFSPQAMISALEAHAPSILKGAGAALSEAQSQDGGLLLDEEVFSKIPSDSIDYAVMEKTDQAAVVAPVDVGWNDIGSWTEAASDPDSAGHMFEACRNVTARSDGPVIGAIGVEDLIIVATGDAVLVARKTHAQDVKKLVEELKRRGREDLL
ncbi:mannose-1-phosphate guanylyltransferase [Hyphococcus luteus]|uniref:Mannose-1-phosphate guanyltransferase n=1 Tax=Hyphococcus luteus TaxID=2058213 RepID=A0A2S7K7S6_9PROT|nr:sugar phosphate nucleotidyltransferase [Marinicaulis flavus]PQA88564.1 mannose-1-phosphate guanyltransferase [Marinicaulis flavus]